MKTVCLLVTAAFCFFYALRAQVYNTNAIRHTNIETNPAYLVSEKFSKTISLTHTGALHRNNKFTSEEIAFSAYNKKNFSGFGLFANHTYIHNTANYTYVGLAMAYRIILFNSIYVKTGGTVKLTNCTAGAGDFDYYSQYPAENTWNRKTSIANANLSLTLSKGTENAYVSLGTLNQQLSKSPAENDQQFPQYYFIHLGDFAKILNLDGWEIRYTTFLKNYSGRSMFLSSHYVLAMHNLLPLTRSSTIRTGLKAGVADGQNIQFLPCLNYFTKNKGWSFMLNFLCDLGYNFKTRKIPYRPQPQLSTTFLFK